MKISTKGRYGLEAIVDLAIHSSEGHISLKSIAERCKISEAYILQIFLVLRRSGIVNSIRGAQGGYVLSRPTSQITVEEVLVALEGPLVPVECIVEGTKKPCDFCENCTTRAVWESMAYILREITNSITIADLVKCYEDLLSKEEVEYYI